MGNSNKAQKLKYSNVEAQIYTIPKFEKSSNCEYLTVVSWNVNMESFSAYAPKDWSKENNKWNIVYQQISEQDPNIICLQELSKPVNKWQDKSQIDKFHPLIQIYMKTNKWEMTFSTPSHSGYCIILVQKKLFQLNNYKISMELDIDPNNKWPAIILKKRLNDNIDDDCKDDDVNDDHKYKPIMILFCVHLQPYPTDHNVKGRREEFDRLYKLSKSKYNMNKYFVLIGDTNMRDNEEDKILYDYKQENITSCWQIVPSNIKKKGMYTFYRNYFYRDNPGVARYDKIFMGQNIQCTSIGVFDKCVSDEKFHFISDHRAIVALLQIS